MSFEEKRRLLLHLDELVRNKQAGTTIQIASKLGTSESTVHLLLEHMQRELEAPIFFDEKQQRYAYKENGLIYLGFLPAEIISWPNVTPYLMSKINGGGE